MLQETPKKYFFFVFVSLLYVSVCFGINATVRKRQEIQWLPYAGLLLHISQLITRFKVLPYGQLLLKRRFVHSLQATITLESQ